MHEMSLMRDVVDVVNEAAEQAGIEHVKAVCMTIGDGRDIVFDLVDGLFAYLSRDTPCAGAELQITHVPLTVRCRKCGTVFPINVYDRETWTCPHCGAHQDYDLNSGMEFRIDQIVVEGTPNDAKGAAPACDAAQAAQVA